MAPVLVDVVVCPTCDSPNLPSSTVCGECGEHMVPPTPPELHPIARLPRCSCGGQDVCIVCVIALYDAGLPL